MNGLSNKIVNMSDENQAPNASPLETLSGVLFSDLTAVNSVILSRMHSDIPMIPKLAGYLIVAGGKRMRPLMTLACAKLFGEDISSAHGLAAAVELIHTATLLHDDVVDESDQRRGQPSANEIFGNQASVLVGDFLFSRSFELMVESGSLDALGTLSRAAAIIAEGEVLQLSIQNKLQTTLEQYHKVIASKTAALFAAACQVGPILMRQDAEIAKSLYNYGYHVGMAFQIADDLLDYGSSTAHLGKSVGDDFKEGKITAPVIFAYQSALAESNQEAQDFWHRTFEQRSFIEGDLDRALLFMSKSGALEKTKMLAHDHVKQAKASLRICAESTLKDLLLELAEYSVTRSK